MAVTLEFGTPKHAYGAIYWSAGAAVDPAPNTPIKVGGTTAAMGGNYDVTQATTNRLTYTGVTTRNFRVSANFSIDLGGAATLIMRIYKGGAANSPPISTNRTVGGTDIGVMALQGVVSLATNEYVELWGETSTGTTINVPYGCLMLASID